MSGYPDNNPKTAIGVTKVPLHLVPPSAGHYLALAFADGAKKYGSYNWREKTVSCSVYIGALKRHADDFWDGEDEAPDSMVHHLAHVMACCAIMLDALSIGKLNDDRPPAGASPRLHADYAARYLVAKALDSVSMEPPIISHRLASEMIRDGVVPADDDEGEIISAGGTI